MLPYIAAPWILWVIGPPLPAAQIDASLLGPQVKVFRLGVGETYGDIWVDHPFICHICWECWGENSALKY